MSKSLLQKRTRLLEGNSKNKKTRRTLKRKFNVQRNLRIVGCNANGLSSKLQSLDHIITQLQPGIILLQETKTKRIGKFNDIKGYTKFEMIRQQSGGGGLMTLVKPDLTPVFISEGNDEAEILTVEIHIDSMSIRVINCYGPQEIDPIQKKTLFWGKLNSEVENATQANCEIIVQFDANSHVGSEVVIGDPNKQNNNGKLFSDFLNKNKNLTLINGTEKCNGTIIRRRIKGLIKEEAVLDFVMVSNTLESFLKLMVIDEAREYPLCSYLNKRPKNSDHFTEIVDFNIKFKKQPMERTEQYNFKSQEGLRIFKGILDTENNLLRAVDGHGDLEEQVNNWYSELDKIFKRCFKKIRISDKPKDTEILKLMRERTKLTENIKKNKNNISLKDELEKIEEKIAEVVAEENHEKIMRNFAHLDQSKGGNCSQGIWDLKAKVFPKAPAPTPAAKLDSNNRLVTDKDGLKKLYQETFTHRLRTRPPKESVRETLEMQQNLLDKRLALTSNNKSEPWTEGDVRSVLKSLKNGKSRDPLGLINEIFKVDGSDLVMSLTKIVNRIKNESLVPRLFIKKNVTTIYKGKGSKLDLDNERGIFVGTVPNTILQKLLHKSIYDTIDSNLGDSNVGGRKGMNIRSHSFIVNSIIHETATTNSKPVDILILDYAKAFDAMSVDVTMNDMFNTGINDNKLNLMNACDKEAHVAIKTPLGLTNRIPVDSTVAQGDVNSTVKCTVSVSNISEEHEDNLEGHIYKYKNTVPVPPLGVVDDIANIALCGTNSALAAAHLNAQTNLKKLTFGSEKCVQMHIGCDSIICPDNHIDTWTLKSDKEVISTVWDLTDVESDKHCMKKVIEWKYLGDVLQSNSKCDANIKERTRRGIGASTTVVQMLSELCLGRFFFQAANILRASLFLSSLISNSEAWVNLTVKNISDLQSIDDQLLRDILSAQRNTPIEYLYLETGNISVKFVIISRRLNFLHYILCQEEDSLIKRFFKAQCSQPVKGDWVSTVKKDLEFLKITMTFEQIKNKSKGDFKEIVRKFINKESFEDLLEQRKKHSKGKEIEYRDLSTQNYLKSDSPLSIEEKRFAFAARTRGLNLKNNFKLGKTNLQCRLCNDHLEDQQSLLVCPALIQVGQTQTPLQPRYSDIFSNNMDKLSVTIKILYKKYQEFQIQVNRQPTRPSSSAPTINVDNDNDIDVNNVGELE